jgi:hypothetical protein
VTLWPQRAVDDWKKLASLARRQSYLIGPVGRTLPRSHGHFDTLLVGTEVGVLVDKTSKTMAAV